MNDLELRHPAHRCRAGIAAGLVTTLVEVLKTA